MLNLHGWRWSSSRYRHFGITGLQCTSSLKRKSKGFVVSYKKAAEAKGYQIQYATNKKFTKNKKTVTVKGGKTVKKEIKKLKKGKKYYVRVRAYKVINGKKVYSTWSNTKAVKVK